MLEADRPFDLRGHPYLEEIYQQTAQKVVLYKAGQVGISEYLISYALHACDQRKATTMYIFPTDTHVSDFSAARLGPAIEASSYLQSIVVDNSGLNGKRGADQVKLKRIRNRFLYLRGGQVKPDGKAPGLKSVAADVLVFDELDEIDPRAPGIAMKRLGHSQIAEVRMASTPTYPDRGIHAEWLLSDQREWFVPCPHCNHKQVIKIGHIITEWDELERPIVWHGMSENRAYAACEHCGKELDRGARGEWVAEHPGQDTVGYHITKLFAPWVDLQSIVRNFQSIDETKRKEAFNQDLGETYVPKGGNLSGETLDACRRDYGHGPAMGEICYMGVDVGRVLHVVVRGRADRETGAMPQRFAGTVSNFEELGRLVERFQPRVTVIDALPETKMVREFQASYRRNKVWIAYYANQKVGPKKEGPSQWDQREGVVNLDRTRMLDETFARFYAGTSTLPASARDIKDYYKHMSASVRVLERDNTGTEIAKYVETGPDHYAHAENYCTAAMQCPVVGWSRGG